ncbi:MAG TPA: hypothetical protein PLT13_02720 [Spirochaetota bacterium]|nr:hypothetical protein [Spirochaetota bacterium]HPR36486.1 hypothetical protein [Spirochaetota bacterium]
MKYLLSGLLAGAVLSLLIFQGVSASELHTGFYFSLTDFDNIQAISSEKLTDFYVVSRNEKTHLLSGDGHLAKTIEIKDSLAEFSGNGRYYIQYGKVGTSIELLGFNGERYWKLSSREKPLLSRNGKLILLIIGDHSRIRMFDTNGNPAGVKEISGRLCTSVEFSEENDFACFGFADGTYYFLDEKGDVLNKGSLPAGNIVKGMRISSNGKFGVVHYGTDKKDSIRIVHISDDDSDDAELSSLHVMKTALHIDNDGRVSILDNDVFIVFDDDADDIFKVKIPAKRPGQAAITKLGEYYFLAYTKITGESQLYVFSGDGRLFYSKEFAGESYLAAAVRDGSVIVRGSDSLFSYKIHVPGI